MSRRQQAWLLAAHIALALLLIVPILLAPVMHCQPVKVWDIVISGETGRAEWREVERCK